MELVWHWVGCSFAEMKKRMRKDLLFDWLWVGFSISEMKNRRGKHLIIDLLWDGFGMSRGWNWFV